MENTVGQRVRIVRESNELSLRAFAKEIKVSDTTLRKIENDENKPSFDTIMSIVQTFLINVKWLMIGDGPMNYDPNAVSMVAEGEEAYIPDAKLSMVKWMQKIEDELKDIRKSIHPRYTKKTTLQK